MSLKVVEVDKTKRQNTSPLQKQGEWPDNGRFWVLYGSTEFPNG